MQPGPVRGAPRPRLLALAGPCVAFAACGGPSGPVDGGRAMAHVEALVEIGPRPFGSDGLARAADYVAGELQELGLEPRRHEVLHEKEKKTIRNVYVQIDGEDPAGGPILILGAHYDTKATAGHAEWEHTEPFVGAIDGGGGPAVLLELARVLQQPEHAPKCNVWLYWIDAEESIDWKWNEKRALLGSRAFCEWLSEQKILPRVKAFVLLDLIGSADLKIDRDGNSDPRLLDLFAAAAERMGERDRLYEFPTKAEIDAYRRRGLNWGTEDDHQNFRAFGVPSVLLIDFSQRVPPNRQNLQEGQQPLPKDPRYEQWWHTPDDDLDAMDPASLAFVGNLVVEALPALDDFVHGKR